MTSGGWVRLVRYERIDMAGRRPILFEVPRYVWLDADDARRAWAALREALEATRREVNDDGRIEP